MSLFTPLSKAIKTTHFHLKRLEEIGVHTVQDFLLYFPRRYTDQRDVCPIIEVRVDEMHVIRGTVASIVSESTWRRRISMTRALITDSTGSIEAVWFNQSYLARTLKKGAEVLLAGKVKFDQKTGKIVLKNPTVEVAKKSQVHMGRIVPIYHETELNASFKIRGKISSKWIREKMFPILTYAREFDEYLPREIRTGYRLMGKSVAITQAHFPASEWKLDQAKRRLAFDELFLLQLAALKRRYDFRKAAQGKGMQISPNWNLIKQFTQSLPWPLTDAQKKALYEIVSDMNKLWPMSRLLEGETGSGKTVVFAGAALHVMRAGFQVCLMAPTEILARQHITTLRTLLKPFDLAPTLLVGSTPESEKKTIREYMQSGQCKFIVGTNALVQSSIAWHRLGLAIVDEQHRFGVRQREILKSFGSPHILHLTATPIPRTLALILYGDQDLSILDEMPPGRKHILTRVVPEEKRESAYRWIEGEIGKGRQAFIIFPLIEASEILDVKAATQEFERLKTTVFPSLKLALLHGHMASEEKVQVMEKFAHGKSDILVSTAVVEVGVDVPNATIMMIEGAERFGLAQLHQFRGRVGRGSHDSYCLLFPSSYIPQTMRRLHALARYSSGFKLAEIDLQLRGPGEVYGTAQSGIPDLKMALLSDSVTIKQAREAAEYIIKRDQTLNSFPLLQKRIAEQENIAIDY